MGIATAPQVLEFMVGEERTARISFDKPMEPGEAITGTPTAVEQTTGDLTIASVAASVATLTINNESVTAGRALTFHISGQLVANSPYTILMTVTTDSTPADVIPRKVILKVVSD